MVHWVYWEARQKLHSISIPLMNTFQSPVLQYFRCRTFSLSPEVHGFLRTHHCSEKVSTSLVDLEVRWAILLLTISVSSWLQLLLSSHIFNWYKCYIIPTVIRPPERKGMGVLSKVLKVNNMGARLDDLCFSLPAFPKAAALRPGFCFCVFVSCYRLSGYSSMFRSVSTSCKQCVSPGPPPDVPSKVRRVCQKTSLLRIRKRCSVK